MESNDAMRLFQRFLKGRGLYVTAAREAVARAALAQETPCDAPALWEAMRPRRAGLSTVYRTLDLLVEAGLVRRLAGEVARFAPVHRRPSHEYLRCRGCGRWRAFESRALDEVLAEVAERLEFEVDRRSVVLSGSCHTCRHLRRLGEID